MIDGIDWSAKYNIEGNRTKFDEAIQQLKEEQALLGDASGSERYKELERKIIGLSAKVDAIPAVAQPAAEPPSQPGDASQGAPEPAGGNEDEDGEDEKPVADEDDGKVFVGLQYVI